jgi:hypothetical protein
MFRHVNRQSDENPQIDHNLLVSHLVLVNKQAMLLKYIKGGHAFFISAIKYPIENKMFARYDVIASIPLTDPIFHGNLDVLYIYPSKAQDSVGFTFTGLVSARGY